MVVVVDPLHSIEARGSLGADTYTTCRGTRYVRPRVGPGVYNTEAQMDVRAVTQAVWTHWATLTIAERQAWAVYAAQHPLNSWTGRPKIITAANWYIRANWWLQTLLLPLLHNPPIDPPPSSPYLVTMAYTTGKLRIAWPNDPYESRIHQYYVDFRVPVHPATQHPSQRFSKMWSVYPFTDLANIPEDMAVGTLDLWWFALDSGTGLRSPWLKYQAVRTA